MLKRGYDVVLLFCIMQNIKFKRMDKKENFYARPGKNGKNWQPLSEHLWNVARLAKIFAEPLGFGEQAEAAGLLHDLGKYREAFQEYLKGERARSAETQHAIYGACLAATLKANDLAFVIAGHHAGLHNKCDLDRVRDQKIIDELSLLKKRFIDDFGNIPLFTPPSAFIKSQYSCEFYIRLLFSCLIDADRLDSAAWPNPPTFGKTHLNPDKLLTQLLAVKERKQSQSPPGLLSNIRNSIFDRCLIAGEESQGFFALSVPTGGGKTLSSMAFALSHAKKHKLRRVIVVIPYLSIIEQNAQEYKKIFGEDWVLECHSAVNANEDDQEREDSELELISENWDAPLIVTTAVQFLESLLASSPKKCRKLHRVAHSVVIFDEVQTLPVHLLKPLFNVFRELKENYGVTFVFSTATNPAFIRCNDIPDGLVPSELKLIIPLTEQKSHFQSLNRINYHFPKKEEKIGWPQLAQKLAASKQVLCVVNLTRHAYDLWNELKALVPHEERPIHLSASMCPQHRLDLIHQIKKLLKEGKPCRVVSTQLIEAGVDIDFPVVWRALGPLDSIVQSAGRCNREGLLTKGDVFVFRPADHQLPPGLYRQASNLAETILNELGADSSHQIGTDPELFSRYFSRLYQLSHTDSTIQDSRGNFDYRSVAEKAIVIQEAGTPVVVPYGEGKNIVEHIRTRKIDPHEKRFSKKDMQKLQRYMVNVHQHKLIFLQSSQQISELLPNLQIQVLSEASYHEEVGLLIESRPLEDFLL